MSKEIITKLDKLDNGLKKLSTERKVVLPHHKTFELVDELSDTSRGEGGFGSTGK